MKWFKRLYKRLECAFGFHPPSLALRFTSSGEEYRCRQCATVLLYVAAKKPNDA